MQAVRTENAGSIKLNNNKEVGMKVGDPYEISDLNIDVDFVDTTSIKEASRDQKFISGIYKSMMAVSVAGVGAAAAVASVPQVGPQISIPLLSLSAATLFIAKVAHSQEQAFKRESTKPYRP